MKFNQVMLKVFLVVTLMLGAQGAAAQKCSETIPGSSHDVSFLPHDNGTVTHKVTGLMWMTCSLGQDWDKKSCVGNAAGYSWVQALQMSNSFTYAGFTDWRLPNRNELETILEAKCNAPAINANIFPGTNPDYYWTSSPYVGLADSAWSIDFGYGAVNASVKNGLLRVRLVRAGR